MTGFKLTKSAVIIFLLNGLLISSWVFFFAHIKTIEQRIVKIRQEISENESRINGINSLQDLVESLDKEKEMIEAAVLTEENIVEFIEFLEQLAQKTNTELFINSASLPKDKQEPGPGFQFRVSGSFREIFHYLVLLENNPFQLIFETSQVQKLSLEERKRKETSKDWEGLFNIIVLSYL